MKKVALALVLITAAVFFACSKDQKVVNDLEGNWKVTAETVNGVATPDSVYANTQYKFEKCKVKKGACPGTITEDGKATSFTYDISEKGTKFTLSVFGISSTNDILEHSSSKFKWSSNDGTDVTVTTIEKK